ncbi:MAG: hypothetical protein ABIK15_14665 [Pseudomonadota bacterium]
MLQSSIGKRNPIILYLIMIFLSAQTGYTQEVTPDSKIVMVTGTGNIVQNDVAIAREEAISESLITAVGLVMSDVTPSDILVPNFQSLNEILYSHRDSFINGYRVLTEIKYKNRYRVLVQARVSVSKIREQLMGIGIMAGEIKKPKVLLMIAEQNVTDIAPHFWWSRDLPEIKSKAEAVLSEIFPQKGFIILRHPNPSAYSEISDLSLQTSEPDQNTILHLAKLVKADIVITGRAFAEQTSNTMGEDIRSFKGTFLAGAIRISGEDEIGKTYQTTITVNTNEIFGGLEAISQAASLAGEDLAVQISSAYTKKRNEQSIIKIVVQGTRILSNFVKFRRALSSLEHVGEIRSSEMKSNEATLNVSYGDDIHKLAESLMVKSFDSFGINISQVLPDQLTITLIPIDKIEDAKAPVATFETNEMQE